MKGDRYGDRWDKPFLFLAHSSTKGLCCWCLVRRSEEIHHARYSDELGTIRDREVIGRDIFPVCLHCHDKANAGGCHGAGVWITGHGQHNRNTDSGLARLLLGYKILSQ